MIKQKTEAADQSSDQEIAQRRDDAIRRALKTPPVTLEALKKQRKPKTSVPSSKKPR